MSPVDAYDLTRVTKEYWKGHTEEYGEITDAIGTFPVVAHGISDDVPATPDPDDIVEYENDRVRDGDDLVTVYSGVDLTPEGSKFLE
jgi:hypothetical protein